MFNYMFDNPKDYNEILQFVSLFLLFVIGAMIYYMSENTDKLKKDISELELECPACPANPRCPKCPDLNCNRDGKCPDCICSTDNKCPECPSCTANANCPTVDDIVSGIFPGRNTGITSGGKFFDIKANESYELMSDYDLYEPADAFPSDSILDVPKPLRAGNVKVPSNQINNTIANNLQTTSDSVFMSLPIIIELLV